MKEDLEYNYAEAISTMDIYCENDVNRLRQWTQSFDNSKCVPKNLSNKQLLFFYNACYGDVEKAKVCLENYYTCRSNGPEFFNHRDLNLDELKQASETAEILILPGKSCEGYEVILQRLYDTDVSKFNSNAIFKLSLMIADLCLSIRGPQSGYMLIIDLRGVKMEHLSKLSLLSLRKLLRYVQEAAPVRMKAIHVLYADSMLDHLMSLLKPFMDKAFYDIIKFHTKTESLAKLHKIVPKTSLPSDYGGTLSDFQTMHKQGLEQLRSMTPYFKAEEEQRRAALPDTVGPDPLQGNFRKLDID